MVIEGPPDNFGGFPVSQSDPRVYLVRQSDPRLPAVAGEYLVHTPGESIEWTAQRPVDAPDPDALANPELVTRLRRRPG